MLLQLVLRFDRPHLMVFLKEMGKTYKCTCLYLKMNILQRNETQTTNMIQKEAIPVIKLKDFGFRIAGHNSLRKIKPL